MVVAMTGIDALEYAGAGLLTTIALLSLMFALGAIEIRWDRRP